MGIPVVESNKPKSLIREFFSDDIIKMLYYHCCRVDIEDNNEKAEMIKELLGSEFVELGTGTNRIAFLHRGLCCMIALDRRGLVDNWTEFKRSEDAPEYFIKVYECNMLILIEEYVTLMDQDDFVMNEVGIKQILSDLSKAYIFCDIGFTLKNACNWGSRSNGDIVILDIGYVYPIKGNESALSCPKCKAQLEYNSNYTSFKCSNSLCHTSYSFMDIRRRMNLDMEQLEDRMIAELTHVEMPSFDRIVDKLYE